MEEQQTEQVEEVVAPAPDLEEAAMIAAISEARGNESPTSPDDRQEQESQSEQTQADEQHAEPQAEAEPKAVLAGMTEDQIKALLAKAGEVDELKSQVRNVFGRFGELNSRIQQLQKPEPATSAPQAAQLNKELARQYHEAILDGDMEKADELLLSMQSRGNSQVSGADANAAFEEKLTQQEKKFEARILKSRHRDYHELTQTDDFKKWGATLPPDEWHNLNESWDALYIADKYDEFKAWRSAQENKSVQADQQRQQRTKRLENAVTPSNSAPVGAPVVTEEEAMHAAIKARARPRQALT